MWFVQIVNDRLNKHAEFAFKGSGTLEEVHDYVEQFYPGYYIVVLVVVYNWKGVIAC